MLSAPSPGCCGNFRETCSSSSSSSPRCSSDVSGENLFRSDAARGAEGVFAMDFGAMSGVVVFRSLVGIGIQCYEFCRLGRFFFF